MFAVLQAPMFRRSETDGTPVIMFDLGEKPAILPMRSIQREFGINDDSPDGRMLALVAQALEFVTALRPGDRLPSEVLTGEASWSPDPVHVAIAGTRLKLQLVSWLGSGIEGEQAALDADSLIQVADDPALRAKVHDAVRSAAKELGLDSPDAVVAMLETLTQELSYIEALRQRLLDRLAAVCQKIDRLTRLWRGDTHRNETLIQVRRLSGVSLAQIKTRFEQVDAQTGEVMAALRNAESQRAFIRSHRDWLHRSLRAWEPIMAEWEAVGEAFNGNTPALLARTYQFLAPRFMAVKEWLSVNRPGQPKPTRPQMVW